MIPMTDGVRLAADIDRPKEPENPRGTSVGKYPIVFVKTRDILQLLGCPQRRARRHEHESGRNFDEAKGVVARNVVHHSKQYSSSVTVTIVK